MIALPKSMLAVLATGWLATALAATNGDIDRGNEAYKSGDYDQAMEHYEAAEQTLGERPELHFNRGLVLLAQEDREGARKAFEHGTESDNAEVRASAEYQLGNLDFDAEAWDGAIQHYTACLKDQPEHRNAKWNLELALERKRQQEEEQEKNEDQENQDQENQDQENQDQENQDQENQDQENQDQENQDQENQDQKDQEQQDQKDQEQQDQKDQEQQDQEQQDQKDQEQQDQQQQDQQQQDQQQQDQPQPQPVEQADLDKALEQLDEEDNFDLGRPMGVMRRPVAKDW